MNTLYKSLPAVSTLLDSIYSILHSKSYALHQSSLRYASHANFVELINKKLDEVRKAIATKEITEVLQIQNLLEASVLIQEFECKLNPKLQHVINGTGVVIHTNLGRSVLSADSIESITSACSGYSSVEFDLETGERGSRHALVRDLLVQITKAEDAVIVNNNAAAVMIALSTFAQGGETIISRGELVEIGGSFRIPDVMECSGSILKDVGTTNKTHLSDYENAINENTKAIMRVHTSNFRLIGFTSKVATHELSALAQKHNLPFIEDLGSGSFIDFQPFGLPKEPTVQEVVSEGVDIVTFSGDKLLGGPQAGIIVGKKDFIAKIKKNQLLRALRPCKLTLAALETTLRNYLDTEKALKNIPTLAMLTIPKEELKQKANKLSRILKKSFNEKAKISIKEDSSRVGGGAFPEADLPSYLVEIAPKNISSTKLKQALLSTNPPIIGRLEEDVFALDIRTLEIKDFGLIARIISEIL